ncbi:MAG: lamin tail domain-containing protein [Candidatus Kryptonium sp.]|nr:lamin tail domain-containing protein [Candidatus Kryptonium sp.]
MSKFLNIYLCLLFSLVVKSFSQGVVINEIMNAPQGGEPEWIEILNFSSEPINLKNWKISNRNTSTKYTITSTDYILQPDSYAVITRSDTIFYFHSIPSKVFILSRMPTFLFRNDSDAVVIFDSTDDIVDSVYYKRTWVVSGYSIERIYPNGNSNLRSTWGTSVDPKRGTPGRKNSIMAKYNDVAMKTFTIEPSQVFQGQPFKVKATVYNIGIRTAENLKVEFYVDLNKNSIFNEDEKGGETTISQHIESTDSTSFEINISGLISGDYQSLLKVVFSPDEDTTNNSVRKSISILPPPLSFNSIVINEIMYAPISPESEWIEIYNRTGTSINLKNWRIGDSQTLRTINIDFILNPNDYVVLSSRDTITSIYPWLRDRANKILVISLPAFNNDEDAVRIYDQYGNLIDSVYYFSSMGGTNGFSLERISPDKPSNLASNWGTSKSPFRATPLLKNSLTQKNKDLTITSIQHSKPALKSNPVEINIFVKNIGISAIKDFTVKLFNDENTDKLPQQNELIGEKISNLNLAPGDSINLNFYFTPGFVKSYNLIATVSHPEDEDTLNNTLHSRLEISYPSGTLLISEVMFAPIGDEPEWIEIYNASKDIVNLKNWKIADVADNITITKNDFFILPNQYLVLSKDSSILSFYPTSLNVLTLSLPTLNNLGDAVVIYDHTGFKIDSLFYYGNWGKTGFSIERIDFEEPTTDSSNWSIPSDSVKATPSRENSSKRKNFDLKIQSVEIPSSIDQGEILRVLLTVQNFGLQPVNEFSIKVYKDLNFDSTGTENEIIFTQSFKITLNKKDSVKLNFEIANLADGENLVIFTIDLQLDENPKNNKVLKKVRVSFPTNCIVINEIMFEPLSGYCEYIELYNRSTKPVNLKNWRFNDMRNQSGQANFVTISPLDLIINPKEYLVLAADSSFYRYLQQGDSVDFKLVILNKSLSLNNDFDDIVITDLTGKIIDSVRYFSNWHSPIVWDKRGRALEKVNPNLASSERSSWMTSSAKVGGTPGRKNTAFIEAPNELGTARINVSPNPFSPDGDGFDDVCLISYDLPFNSGILNVKIFDSYGRQIKTLAVNQFTNKNGNLLWDGTDDNGKIARIGIYIILFEAISENGETFKRKFTVVLAKKL